MLTLAMRFEDRIFQIRVKQQLILVTVTMTTGKHRLVHQ